MQSWIDFAQGPLLRISVAVCLMGLMYRLALGVWAAATCWYRAADRRLPFAKMLRTTLGWLLPSSLLRVRPVFSLLSFAFHIGIIVVGLFYVGHVALWQPVVPVPWPVVGPGWSDPLTILALVALVGVLVGRVGVRTSRALTRTGDVLVLGLLLFLLLTGYLAAHPEVAPGSPMAWVLAHMLLGDATLVALPTTKLAHCVLWGTTRLTWELGWHFPADTGRHVARVLGKEGKPI
jgi:nitrate reductase gamma subunit